MTAQSLFAFEPTATPTSANERTSRLADPGFGRVFTDHMAVARWSADKGWHDMRIVARAPLSFDPATAVLHYAQEIFEGLKAYRTADGGITLFRPQANAARFRNSARRMAMAELPEELFIASGLGLPIVIKLANRAIGSPIFILNDHSFSLSIRD